MDDAISHDDEETYKYFKFRPINKRLIDSLVHSHLWFAKREALNDPFDCQLDLSKSLLVAASSSTGLRKELLHSLVSDREFISLWETQIQSVGICSFSLKLNDHLLWSHYADEHKGVCLLYRFQPSFINAEQNMFLGTTKVNYTDNPLIDWLRNDAPIDVQATDIKAFNKFIAGLIPTFFSAKAPPWSFETEARLIRAEHGALRIPHESLIQVVFGLRTPQADIDLITKVARDYCGCNKFYRLVRDKDSDFGVIAEEV
jgi:hypothetical protein